MADEDNRDREHEPDPAEREGDESPELARTYREAFASLGKAISLAADWDAKRVAFLNGLREALTLWHGIDRNDIIDTCYAIAEAKGLTEHFGVDDIQVIISSQVQIGGASEQQHPNANGKYNHGEDNDAQDDA